MTYPLYLEIFKEAGRPFLIMLYQEGSDEPDFYEAKDSEELLEVLARVYSCHPGEGKQ